MSGRSPEAPGSSVDRGQSPSPGALSVRGLGKRYAGSERPALAGVDLEAEAGGVVAVVGESGSGKTTLLRLVAGLEVPDSGVVRIGERTVAGPGAWVPPEDRGVGMVFQEFALFPHMTVEENVAFGIRSLPARKRGERVRALLEGVGLGGLGSRYPHQLSGGQRQRVALARALAPRPRVLLLDEPFSNLDPPLKVELRERMGELLERTGVTAMFVVHESEDVFDLAERVVVLREGRVLQVGPPEEVYAAPRSEHVARLFGPANVVPGRVVEGGVETALGFVACPDPGGPSPKALFRPEDVMLRADATGGDGATAVVEDVHRRGSRCRLRLTIEGEAGARETILAEVEGLPPGIEPGDPVPIRVRDGAVTVIPGEEGTG